MRLPAGVRPRPAAGAPAGRARSGSLSWRRRWPVRPRRQAACFASSSPGSHAAWCGGHKPGRRQIARVCVARATNCDGMQAALPERRETPYVSRHGADAAHPGGGRRPRDPRSARALPGGEAPHAGHRGARRPRGTPRLRQRPLPSGGARPDAARRGRPRLRPLAAHPVRHADRHADRDGRGDRPHHRPGTRRRRLRAEAVQPARAAGAHPRRAAPRRRAAGAARRRRRPRACASPAGRWSRRGGGCSTRTAPRWR